MPTENMNCKEQKVFIKTNQHEEPKELGIIEEIKINEYKNNEYISCKNLYDECAHKVKTVTVPIKLSKKVKKRLGIETITRKRFIKLLMGHGIQRNAAIELAERVHTHKLSYSPIMVSIIVNWIIEKMIKGDKK